MMSRLYSFNSLVVLIDQDLLNSMCLWCLCNLSIVNVVNCVLNNCKEL